MLKKKKTLKTVSYICVSAQALAVSYICVSAQALVAQLCPTLFSTMDYSPPGSSVHGTFQSRSELPFPYPRDLPNPGIELRPPVLQADSLLYEPQS